MKRDLFGGALAISLPEDAVDVRYDLVCFSALHDLETQLHVPLILELWLHYFSWQPRSV